MISKKTIEGLGKRFAPTMDTYIVYRKRLTESAGGIVLATGKEPSGRDRHVARATIIAMGPGRTTEQGKRIEMSGRVGQDVLFSAYSGVCLGEEARLELGKEVDAGDILFIREPDVLSTIEE